MTDARTAVPIRLGLLGTSRVNERIVNAAKTLPEVDVVALASRDHPRAVEQAARLGVAETHAGYSSLLDSDAVDAVYLALPNSEHAGWAAKALDSNKHVLVEKPLSREPAVVAELFDKAKTRALVLLEGMMFRHHPQVAIIQNIVRGGAIGRLRLVQAHFSFPLQRAEDVRWRPELHGGALMDLGCYCVAASRIFAGEPVEFHAVARKVESGVDGRLAATLVTSDAVMTRFDVDFGLPRHQSLVLHGEQGRINVGSPFHCNASHVQLYEGVGHGQDQTEVDVGNMDPFQCELEHFVAMIREKPERRSLGAADAIAQAQALSRLHLLVSEGPERHVPWREEPILESVPRAEGSGGCESINVARGEI